MKNYLLLLIALIPITSFSQVNEEYICGKWVIEDYLTLDSTIIENYSTFKNSIQLHNNHTYKTSYKDEGNWVIENDMLVLTKTNFTSEDSLMADYFNLSLNEAFTLYIEIEYKNQNCFFTKNFCELYGEVYAKYVRIID